MAATFGLSMAMLGIQIGWTRIFSFMIWYHFAFLVISTAMLGFTVGGLVLNLRPAFLQRSGADILFIAGLTFSAATAVGLGIVCNLPFVGGVLDSVRDFGLFLGLIVLVAAGFLAAGLFIALVIAQNPERVAHIYAANLTGSGAGCLVAVLLLERLLPATAVLAFTLIALVATAILIPRIRPRGRAVVVAVLVCSGLCFAFARSLNPLAEPFYMRSTKPFPALSRDRIVSRLSNSLSIVDLFKAEELTGLWGLSDRFYFANHPGRAIPDRIGFCIDGWALTFAYHVSDEITEEPVFDYLPSTIVYDAISPRSALVIGSGGGIDVICARRRGVPSITAVEINPITMRLNEGELAPYNGAIFGRPGVEPVIAEGRNFITSAGSRRWDLIQLSGVDTLAASQAGAFTLAESYLYTREAFEAFLSHLNPGGVLTLTRWLFDPPRHNLRVITVADAALRRLGVRDTASHIMLIADTRRRFAVSLISRSPFTFEQSKNVLEVCRMKGFIPLAIPHFTLGPETNAFQTLVNTEDKTGFIRDYPFDISVTTDDRPFFFEQSKWRNAWSSRDYILNKFNGHLILLVTTLIVALLGFAFILVPARYALAAEARAAGHYRPLAYFACLGLGYALVEMVLIQKLTLYLGNPVYALAVVLCAMLIFSGFGSLFSGRVSRYGRVGITAVSLAIALTLVGYRMGIDAALHETLAVPLGQRIVLALAMLALPSALMGAPFPAGIAALGAHDRASVVRVWVVNGYFSVLGACLAMILSISFGFGWVLLTGAAIYALAAAAWSPFQGGASNVE